jgi:hypothetical protein
MKTISTYLRKISSWFSSIVSPEHANYQILCRDKALLLVSVISRYTQCFVSVGKVKGSFDHHAQVFSISDGERIYYDLIHGKIAIVAATKLIEPRVYHPLEYYELMLDAYNLVSVHPMNLN